MARLICRFDSCWESPCDLFLETRDWLIGAPQLWRSFVILKHANAQYSAHPQTPLPTTKPGLQGRDWNHSRREF